MDDTKAWEIVKKGTGRIHDFTEDEAIIYEEALLYIFITAAERYEEDPFYMWEEDAEAGAFNLAFYYEQIGKYDLAIKYYKISEKYGCDFAEERIEEIEARL